MVISASRQKNCNSCVQTKRRCDRRTPVCSRCAEKKLRCSYGKVAPSPNVSSSHESEQAPLTALVTGPSLFGEDPGSSVFCTDPSSMNADCLGALPMDLQSDLLMDFNHTSTIQAPDVSDASMNPLMNLIGDAGSASRDQWIVQPNEVLPDERPTSPASEEIVRGYREMSTFCNQFELAPWNLHDATTHMFHVTNRIKGFTADMANRNSTPFLHRHLYQNYTPQCILSCFTTCVLYTTRTPGNSAMVMRALHIGVRELVNAETGRLAVTALEKLARAQTLFMYQIICLFDGDISLRNLGEKHIQLLKTWLEELCKVRENLGDLAQLEDGVARESPPENWERWVFAESVRRTVLIAYSTLSLYEILKEPEFKEFDGPWSYAHRWTLGRSLWEAASPFEFARAWREKPHFIISNYSFRKFLEHGRADDVDEFAELLLSVYMGLDAAKEFLSTRTTTTN